MEDLAEHLRQALKGRGITQKQLAEQLHTTQPVISRTLKASVVNDRSHWPAILDLLGLEVVLQPVGGHTGRGEEIGNAAAPAFSPAEIQAARALLIPPSKPGRARGLTPPAPIEGPPIEELLNEHRGPDL